MFDALRIMFSVRLPFTDHAFLFGITQDQILNHQKSRPKPKIISSKRSSLLQPSSRRSP
jgi:hypothetical protein